MQGAGSDLYDWGLKGVSRMEQQALINFAPKKFIEMLLKLDGRAKGYEVKVEVTKRKKKEAQTA